MRRLALIGCMFVGLLLPARLALAENKSARDMAPPTPPPEKLDPAETRTMMRTSLESGVDCDCGCGCGQSDALYGAAKANGNCSGGLPTYGGMGGNPQNFQPQDNPCCCECCCHSTGIWAMGELNWLRYHRADGVRVGGDGDGNNAQFDFEMTPRVTVGWVSPCGIGVRGRWWQFDHNATTEDGTGTFGVDTYTADVELFETFALNCNWDLEIAAGGRWNEFTERMNNDGLIHTNTFRGPGLVASVELRRCVCGVGVLWTRARASMLMADKDIFDSAGDDDGPLRTRLTDVVVGTLELAGGYDMVLPVYGGSYMFARAQVEVQNWYNYSTSFVPTNGDIFGGPSDVGFGGFGVAVGWAR